MPSACRQLPSPAARPWRAPELDCGRPLLGVVTGRADPQHSAGQGCGPTPGGHTRRGAGSGHLAVPRANGDHCSTLLGISHVAGDRERLGCPPSCLPAVPSAREVHSQLFFHGSDRKDSPQCQHPPASDVLGGHRSTSPRLRVPTPPNRRMAPPLLSDPAEWLP